MRLHPSCLAMTLAIALVGCASAPAEPEPWAMLAPAASAPEGRTEAATALAPLPPGGSSAPTPTATPAPLAPGRFLVTPLWPHGAPVFGAPFHAVARVAQQGHLYCLLQDGAGLQPLFPVFPASTGWVSGLDPVLLPESDTRGNHLNLRLNHPGRHEVWCLLSHGGIVAQLPPALQPGGSGEGYTLQSAQARVLQLAGSQGLAQGSATFSVPTPEPQSPEPLVGSPRNAAPAAAPAPRPVLPPQRQVRPQG